MLVALEHYLTDMVRGEVQTVTKTDVLADFESQPTSLGCCRVNFAENLAGGGFYPTRSGNFLVRLRHLLVRRFNHLVSSLNLLVRLRHLLIRLFNHPSRSGGVRVGWGDGPLVAARNQLGVSGHSGVVELEGIAGVGVAGDGNLLGNHPVAVFGTVQLSGGFKKS